MWEKAEGSSAKRAYAPCSELPRDGGKAWRRHAQKSEFSGGGWSVTVAHRIEDL